MFIVSKKNFLFRYPSGEAYRVARDYMGEVPDSLAELPLFKLAVKGGDIMTPATHSDKDIAKADEQAVEAASAADIRPDAPKTEKVPAEDEKPLKKASRRSKQ